MPPKQQKESRDLQSREEVKAAHIAQSAKLDVITHASGFMFVTDLAITL